jgi:phosphoglycerol transferase MdoB-like AlkP superfamily enzyme
VSNFYPMKRGDVIYIVSLLVLSILSFLPWSRRITLFGMALFGWLMVALMVVSPAVVLLRFLVERDKNS